MNATFAKLMGHIKEIEIGFEILSTELDQNFINYDETIKQLTTTLEDTFSLSDKSDKTIDIKEVFKKTSQITKKDLDQPLKSFKKNFDQMEINLNKIIEQIKAYNEKSLSSEKTKLILNPEENLILEKNIQQLFSKINANQQCLELLLDSLIIVHNKLQDAKHIIDQHDAIKEEVKLTKQISDFIKKSRSETYIVTENTSLLLEQLEILKNNIISSSTTEHLSPSTATDSSPNGNTLLNHFELKCAINKASCVTSDLDPTVTIDAINLLDQSHSRVSPETSPRLSSI